ncbi:MAG: T9SS type A sorting domain-containing protein, partial [Melioribacteraceae bacterium]
KTGEIGVGDLGYSDSSIVAPNEWYRLIITVDLLDTSKYAVEYYIDGHAVPHGEGSYQKIDNRFSFGSVGYVDQLILMGDNDNDDGLINVAQVVLYNRVLSAEEVEALGGYGHIVGVEETDTFKPDVFALNQNYPNPFNPSTIISYSIPKQSMVSLKIYNVLGQLVTTLVNKQQNAGSYQYQFNASNLTSGIYFYSIKAGDFTKTQKMMLIK